MACRKVKGVFKGDWKNSREGITLVTMQLHKGEEAEIRLEISPELPDSISDYIVAKLKRAIEDESFNTSKKGGIVESANDMKKILKDYKKSLASMETIELYAPSKNSTFKQLSNVHNRNL